MGHKNDIHRPFLDRNDPLLLELSKSPVQATNRYLAKLMLPEFNVKTHFKAATSLYLSLPDSLVDNHKQSKTARKPFTKDELRKTVVDPDEIDEFSGRRTQGSSLHKLPSLKPRGQDFVEDEAQQIQSVQRLMPGGGDRAYQLDGVNPVDVSKKILLKCNVIRNKNGNSQKLSKGSGHLISCPDKSMRQVYEEIYHKTIQ